MRTLKFIYTAAAAACVAAAMPASAGTFTVPLVDNTANFTRTPGGGRFLDTFLFNIPSSGRASVRVESIQDPARPNVTNVNFNATNVKFNGVTLAINSRGVYELRTIIDAMVTGGVSTLVVQGAAGSQGTYTGSLTFAIPEPATWGLMILGFGAIGTAMRGSRRRKLTTATA